MTVQKRRQQIEDEEMTHEESIEENLGDAQESDMEPAVEEFSEDEEDIVENRQTSVDLEGSCLNTVNCERNVTVLEGKAPAKGSKIKYQLPDSDHWLEAQDIKQSRKASGKNRWWYNVRDLKDGSLKSINLAEVKEWKYKEEEVLLSSAIDKTEVLVAKRQELENLRKHEVHTEVDDNGQKRISCRWIVTEKSEHGGAVNSQNSVSDKRVQGRRNQLFTERLLLTLAASSFFCLDTKSAFLHGKLNR